MRVPVLQLKWLQRAQLVLTSSVQFCRPLKALHLEWFLCKLLSTQRQSQHNTPQHQPLTQRFSW